MKIYLVRAKYNMINDSVRVYKHKIDATKSAQDYINKFGAIESAVMVLELNQYEEFDYTGEEWRYRK